MKCEAPPKILNGYYHSAHDEYHGSTGSNSEESDSYSIGTELQAKCESPFTLDCPYHSRCGRITCERDGSWAPREGQIITSCTDKALTVVSPNGHAEPNGNSIS
jgi:hypothetical protein